MMASIRVESIEIVTMPSSDREFADRVAAAARELAAAGEHVAIDELKRHLVDTYPGVLISRQSALATFDGSPRTWYIYRDG